MSPGRLLALMALGLAALAVAAGSGGRGVPGGDGPAEITPELESGEALLDPLELARMIRERRPFRLLDVRDSSEFIRFSLPTAAHARVGDLAALPVEAGRPVVLYDDGSGAAVRGWLLLRRLGHPEVLLLQDGVVGWLDHVLNPVLPAGTAAERARFDRVAELSRYFGGRPRVGEPPAPGAGAGDADAAITLLSRRGCY